jgi:hypothetical protein
VKCFVTLLTIPHFEEPENNTITTKQLKKLQTISSREERHTREALLVRCFPSTLFKANKEVVDPENFEIIVAE